MTPVIQVELQHGLPAGEHRHRLVGLREPTGHDEAMLVGIAANAPPGVQASALVHSLVVSAGEDGKPSLEQVRQLTVGDRERILFAVAARLLGPEIDLVAACPACRELAEIEVRFAELRQLDPLSRSDPVTLVAEDGEWLARCRPATCGDVEWAVQQDDGGVRSLLVRCLLRLSDPDGKPAAAENLPAECEDALARVLATCDPAAERRISIECPACASEFSAVADGFIIARTGFSGPGRFYESVYRMAHSYHWSEAEILSLPLARRRQYLAVAERAEAKT